MNGLLFGLLCLSLYYGWLRPGKAFSAIFEPPTAGEAFNALMTNLIGFFLVAMLISAMATRMEKSSRDLGAARKDLSYYRHLNDMIVSSFSGGIIVTDLDGKVTMSTPRGRELLSMTITEGWRLDEKIQSLGGPPLNFSGTLIKSCDIPLSLPGERHVMISISQLGEDGRLVGYLALVRDESEVVRIRGELGLRRGWWPGGKMAANMAHEIKNPLGSISGAAQMLKSETSEGSSESELLAIIHKESLRLAEVLDNFLRFANPPRPEKQAADIATLCRETATLFEKSPFFAEKKLDLSCDCGNSEMTAVMDPNQFRQALWNLLQNGRKASPDGGKISIVLRKSPPWAIVEVSDTGVGMPKSELDKMQEPFKRGFGAGPGWGFPWLQDHGAAEGAGIDSTRSGTTSGSSFPGMVQWRERSLLSTMKKHDPDAEDPFREGRDRDRYLRGGGSLRPYPVPLRPVLSDIRMGRLSEPTCSAR